MITFAFRHNRLQLHHKININIIHVNTFNVNHMTIVHLIRVPPRHTHDWRLHMFSTNQTNLDCVSPVEVKVESAVFSNDAISISVYSTWLDFFL